MKLNITSNTGNAKWFIDIAPWYSLILFGCYCLTKLGIDLLTFNDYPEEIFNLEKDIKIAEIDLKKRGYDVSKRND